MIFVKHGPIMSSQIDLNFFTGVVLRFAGFVFQRANSFFSRKTMNWSEKKKN